MSILNCGGNVDTLIPCRGKETMKTSDSKERENIKIGLHGDDLSFSGSTQNCLHRLLGKRGKK